MAIVFAVRGDSFDARYSSSGKTAFKMNPSQITTAAGGLSGTVYDLTSASGKFVSWLGGKNTPNGRAISILIRMAPNYTGSPASNEALWALTSGIASASLVMPFLELRHLTTGNLSMNGKNESAVSTVANAGAWSPTSGTYYDIVYTWDGTTTSNSSKLYVDASLLVQATSGAALSSSWDNTYWHDIIIGATPNILNSKMLVDEFVIWDTVIDPTQNQTLVSGSGLLNGASRTSLVSVSAFDGQSTSGVDAAKIQTGVTFTVNGTAYVGTYDGSDRWTDPGAANVKKNVQYKANSTTNNMTGTYSPAGGRDGFGEFGG